jgi:hypothetical protein
MNLKLTWPHNVVMNLHDPDMRPDEMLCVIVDALNSGTGFRPRTKKSIVVVPPELLATALIEITA